MLSPDTEKRQDSCDICSFSHIAPLSLRGKIESEEMLLFNLILNEYLSRLCRPLFYVKVKDISIDFLHPILFHVYPCRPSIDFSPLVVFTGCFQITSLCCLSSCRFPSAPTVAYTASKYRGSFPPLMTFLALSSYECVCHNLLLTIFTDEKAVNYLNRCGTKLAN